MDYLPGPRVAEADGELVFKSRKESVGSVKAFYGNFAVVLKALTYVLMLGRQGIPEAAMSAALNANYMMKSLEDLYAVAFPGRVMHEFVLTAEPIKKQTGVTALDIAKALLDHGMHPPTVYFPINVREALMLEPTDTESKATIDKAVGVFREIYALAQSDPGALREAPLNTPVRRLDEVTAAREPILRYRWQ
jgi:glycine dehydrogenase subunit 2